MKLVLSTLSALLVGAPVASLAFGLDIVGDAKAEFGQSPRSIFVPGYGEVVFEAGLDCALVVDSAYASTGEMDAPSSMTDEHFASLDNDAPGPATAKPTYIGIGVRSADSRTTQQMIPPVGPSGAENPPDGWNAVPEAASAALGLIGTLLLLLRRRARTSTRMAIPARNA